MTYGVDQCRMCGIVIKPWSNKSIAEYEAAQRKPPMAEAQWRRRGFLAGPTRQQMANPVNGCCIDCGAMLLRRKFNPGRRLTWAFFGALILLVGIVMVLTFIRH